MEPTTQTDRWSSKFCAVCQASLTSKPRTHLGKARLVECGACQSWMYLPRPTAQEQAALHDDETYFEHPYFQHRRYAQERNDRRCRQIFTQLGMGLDLTTLRGDRLLDVGCDTGAFLLSAARQFGVVPIGLDVSSRAISQLKAQGIEAYLTTLENAPTQLCGFSVITAIDLLEHVANPRTFLQELCDRLRPGGVAYLETPNIHSSIYQLGCVLSNLTGGRPAALYERLFPPQHIQYFTRMSFVTLAQECGFEVAHLTLRSLPFTDLATSFPVRLALTGLQVFDRLAQRAILICALLRKPL